MSLHALWQAFAARAAGAAEGKAGGGAFTSSIVNYYQTDAISRASSAMAKCTITHADRIASRV